MAFKETVKGVEGVWVRGAWYCCDYHRYTFYPRPGTPDTRGLCCPWHHMQFGVRRPDGTIDYCICNQNLFHHKEMGEPVRELEPIPGVTDQFGNKYYFIPDWCPELKKRSTP